jgi:hypothetical protein
MPLARWSARQSAHAEGDVQSERAGGNHLHLGRGDAFAQAHDAALAKLLLDGGYREFDGPVASSIARAWCLASVGFGFLVFAAILIRLIRLIRHFLLLGKNPGRILSISRDEHPRAPMRLFGYMKYRRAMSSAK